jgi:hypothetical protein
MMLPLAARSEFRVPSRLAVEGHDEGGRLPSILDAANLTLSEQLPIMRGAQNLDSTVVMMVKSPRRQPWTCR